MARGKQWDTLYNCKIKFVIVKINDKPKINKKKEKLKDENQQKS